MTWGGCSQGESVAPWTHLPWKRCFIRGRGIWLTKLTQPQIREEPLLGSPVGSEKPKALEIAQRRTSFFLAPTYCVTRSQYICLSVNLCTLKENIFLLL